MKRQCVAILLSLLLAPSSALAVPTLLPLVPLVAALVAKGAALIGSLVFLILSVFKRKRRLSFIVLGLASLVLFVLLVIFIEYG